MTTASLPITGFPRAPDLLTHPSPRSRPLFITLIRPRLMPFFKTINICQAILSVSYWRTFLEYQISANSSPRSSRVDWGWAGISKNSHLSSNFVLSRPFLPLGASFFSYIFVDFVIRLRRKDASPPPVPPPNQNEKNSNFSPLHLILLLFSTAAPFIFQMTWQF